MKVAPKNLKPKVAVIFGTRPEAIKMAPVIKELRRNSRHLKTCVVVTAQHRHMLDQILRLFGIRPDHDLNIMRPDQTLFDVISACLNGVHRVLKAERPDLVLVQGDTATVFAASLACYFMKISVGHVEAGLRTYDKFNPFPEEMNRRLTGVLADLHFAPTRTAFRALAKENVDPRDLFITGNTVIDALFEVVKQRRVLPESLRMLDPRKKLVLVTAHRRESFGAPFRAICEAIRELVRRNPGIEVVYPVHLNPNVRGPVHEILGGLDRVHLIPPLEYEFFTKLMARSYLVLTDSGGVQEEAPSLGVPVLVMRECTERPEAVKAGTVRLVGMNAKKIVREAERLIHDARAYRRMSRAGNPYGDGKASKRIVAIILKRLCGISPRMPLRFKARY